ncbi:MAG: Trk family potassium uptake protein [Clostridia bacterium]|nr:Trk family potassium uptake protein [Clostridia bacterium]
MIRTIPLLGIGRGIFAGIFLSVSAFCNAGFDPLGGVYGEFSSLLGFGSDPLILLTLAAVIILGAAGFLVWSDLWDYFRTRKRISMYSRFVLIITGCLLGIGFLLIAILEWNNPATLGDMSVPEKLLQAFFQSVTPRTAGFDAIGQTEMTECAKAVSMMLMLIGGASGSTAGGIKVVTFGVLMAAVRSTLRGEKEIHVLKRRIDREAVTRAMAIMFFVLFAVFACAIFIAAFDGVALEAALYECFSAFCTVGLSLALTPTLGYVSRAVLICAMFTGRVGILTLSVVLVPKERASADISYPEAKLLIG